MNRVLSIARAAARGVALGLPAALCVLPSVPSAGPVDKPSPRAAARAAAAASTPTPAHPATAAQAAPAAPVAPQAVAEADPMERLRQRLAERLTAPGGGSTSGTLDLQVGTRSPATPAHGHAPTRPAAPGAARGSAPGAAAHAGAPHAAAAPAAGPTARDIAQGRAEGIAWSRPASPVPSHRVAAPAEGPAAQAHAPVAAARRATTAARGAHAGSTASGKGHGGAAHAPHWGYEGAAGPATWGALKPEFGLCANGQRQSPIDIRGGLAVDLEPVKFDYRPSAFSVIDNGHTVQVNMPPGNAIEVGGRRYELVQFHFHRPSEERIDGRQFEMSLHLVHKDPSGRLAVVGVLLGKGPAHPAVQTVWNNLPLEKNEEAAARAQLDPSHLLPEDRRYFTYMGSLTTPPCSEGVQWVVMRTPVTVTPEQVELFARIYPMNARPAQPVAGRRIMQSQ